MSNNTGRPDYAVTAERLLIGYVELKAPGIGVVPRKFSRSNKKQFKRYESLPNLLYSDGNEWALYRGGKRKGRVVRLDGDVVNDGANAVDAASARALDPVLWDFLGWEPNLPLDCDGRVDLKRFADMLAPLCRMLRDDAIIALKKANSLITRVKKEWQEMLFPLATDAQFADAYAQTVVFALLLGRTEGASPLTVKNAVDALNRRHGLLSKALEILADRRVRDEVAVPLDLLLRVIAAVPLAAFAGQRDPWLYFYEDFLATYDPKMRKDVGVYYTPLEVVSAQVRLLDDILVNRLGKELGFAEPSVATLDPAVGTGTYLLGVIEHALNRVREENGIGSIPAYANALARNLYGFELTVGAYAVAELRVSAGLAASGASTSTARIYLCNTLESPDREPKELPLLYRPISEQRKKAIKVKRETPVLVCLGNPPYDRHDAFDGTNIEQTGAWVRWGDSGRGHDSIFRDFSQPVQIAGRGVDLKNLCNFYVYFWRWALWKVFEQGGGAGAVSLITASSWLRGTAFMGMREHIRRICDDVWVLDLGGNSRGSVKTENVFAIQTPVAITMACRTGDADLERPARVRHVRIEGSREEKLSVLQDIRALSDADWRDCPEGWLDPFCPKGEGEYFAWPALSDIMPWQHTGVMVSRTWPIAPDEETLALRWRSLLRAEVEGRAVAFKEDKFRKLQKTYKGAMWNGDPTPLAELPDDSPMPDAVEYAYRSFDRQSIIADVRLISVPSTPVWYSHGDQQLYLTTYFKTPLGGGPALTCATGVPDRHHFAGCYGGKDVVPLYRTPDASQPNIAPGLTERLSDTYGRRVTAEDVVAYIYGVMAHPAFTERFAEELGECNPRIPITLDARLFDRCSEIGSRLIYLHTWRRRFKRPQGQDEALCRKIKCTKSVTGSGKEYPETFAYDRETQALRIGDGEFAPVPPEVFDFEVSGRKVVGSWIQYRMKDGAGRRSSPLDDIRPQRWTAAFNSQLLELLRTLEATVGIYPEQKDLLEDILAGKCIKETDLLNVPDVMRKPPTTPATPTLPLTE